jgi:hypothetical protein
MGRKKKQNIDKFADGLNKLASKYQMGIVYSVVDNAEYEKTQRGDADGFESAFGVANVSQQKKEMLIYRLMKKAFS